MKNNIAVSLKHISKRYYLYSKKPTFAENLNPFKRPREFWALQDINLSIQKGERVGIIGPNGAGKTTLLRIIAGITKPTSGKISIAGKVVSLIELTAGFHPEMTGAENIWISGMLLGMDKRIIKQKFDDIIAFANIGDFIYQPVYTFSNGMLLRLGFSIAMQSDPDIFISDEMISVGDKAFQQKVNEILDKQKQTTFIIASNKEEDIMRFVNRIIDIDHASIAAIRTANQDYPQTPNDNFISENQFRMMKQLIKTQPLTVNIYGTSMYPTLTHNSLVRITHCQFNQIKNNDIVVFYSPLHRLLIAHRVINKTSNNILTRGDNNSRAEPTTIPADLILGLIN